MKKLLTLAIGLFATVASLNAQFSCEFTTTTDSLSGVYYFDAPQDLSPNLYFFEWFFNNGSNVAFGSSVVFAYNAPMIDNVTLNVYGADSNIVCVSVIPVNILVGGSNTNCPIDYYCLPSDLSTYTFTSPGSNYPPTWTFPDGTTITGFEVEYTFPQSGINTVCMLINGSGFFCQDCVDILVSGDTIINPDPACNADFWASTSSLVGYFIPNYYSFSNNISSYSWDFGDGSTSTENYPYHVYNAPGYYDVCLTLTNGNCTDNMCQTVYIPEYSFPPIDTSCYAGYIITQENPYEVTIVNASTGNNLEFSWTLTGNGISVIASGAYPSLTIQSTGDFLFCLDVIGADSCFSSYCDSITIGDNGILGGRINAAGFSINVVSPQTITGFVTGIDKTEAPTFEVYPNPFNDFIVVKNMVSNSQYNVFSVDGRSIASGNIAGNNQVISTSALSAGIYVLQLISKEGQIATQKIIKK
jgi:PKD repeat protein